MTSSDSLPDMEKSREFGTYAWRIVSGEYFLGVQEMMPNTVFAGCHMDRVEQVDAKTGLLKRNVARWECRNRKCQHRWWRFSRTVVTIC